MDDTILTCDPERCVLIAGPTASGKSAVALELAQAQGRHVVNADALQVFDGWRILTARPDARDLELAPHHLYGHMPVDGSYSVGDWLRDVRPLLDRRPAPVIVGGTGLYFQALLNGLADIPATDPDVRALASDRMAQLGNGAMVAELDPLTREKIDTDNPMRVQRAWEVLHQTGRGLAAWQADTGPPLLHRSEVDAFLVTHAPEVLNARIDLRFDQMLDKGGWDEARRMDPLWDPDHQSSRAIGAPQLIAALRGQMSETEAISKAKLATRQYAKRQRTWNRNKMGDWVRLLRES